MAQPRGKVRFIRVRGRVVPIPAEKFDESRARGGGGGGGSGRGSSKGGKVASAKRKKVSRSRGTEKVSAATRREKIKKKFIAKETQFGSARNKKVTGLAIRASAAFERSGAKRSVKSGLFGLFTKKVSTKGAIRAQSEFETTIGKLNTLIGKDAAGDVFGTGQTTKAGRRLNIELRKRKR